MRSRSQARESRFDDDLVGLDPQDPEAQAFAAHLDRIERTRANYTVEGYLAGVADFADSANRATGHRRLAAVVVVSLLLLGVLVALWSALGYMLSAFTG
ncbi:MAG: hypothetical protein GEU98_11105 [Pseudonocardiaceae bacterium]|nr:hypothetical protein [Pseudonocardiaceae bacterium]